jgi:hypothetical protein
VRLLLVVSLGAVVSSPALAQIDRAVAGPPAFDWLEVAMTEVD